MSVPPFFVSELCPLIFYNFKKILYTPLLCNHLGYLHEVLKECISGQENVSHTIMVAFAFFVSELRPFDFVLCLFLSCTLYNSFTVHDISNFIGMCIK